MYSFALRSFFTVELPQIIINSTVVISLKPIIYDTTLLITLSTWEYFFVSML